MSDDIRLEYSLENKAILSLENGDFKYEELPNDYPYMVRGLFLNGRIEPLDNYPVLKKKIGLKVLLMRLGIVFKEIIVKTSFDCYISIIYNDYLNVFYSASSYSEDFSLYMAYNKAVSDIIQCINSNSDYNQCIELIEAEETFTQIDYLYNKFCQDIEVGLITDEIVSVDLNKEEVFNDFYIKYYELFFGLKKSNVHFVLGRLYDKDNKLLSEKLYFNKDISTAIDKIYFMLFDSLLYKKLTELNVDWTQKIPYKKIFDCCNNLFFTNEKNYQLKLKEVTSDRLKELINTDFYTKSLIDFYQVEKIKFEKNKDPYLNSLVSRLLQKIKINYIGD